MIVVPAIDIRAGRCVRLAQGDPARETVYADDPVEVALRFEAEGAGLLHVVDLDAALDGRTDERTRAAVAGICRAATIPVQVGGGLRSFDALEGALSLGAARVVVGTAALEPAFVREAAAWYGERLVVAVDVRHGRAMTHGWAREGDAVGPTLQALDEAGAPRYLVTSVEADGVLGGPDVALYRRVVALTQRPVLASGGVRSVADVADLAAIGVEGVVCGRALLEGTLSLRDATDALGSGQR